MTTKITVSFNDAPIDPPDLAEQVRTAASRGDFASADAVLAQAESANEGELHRLVKLKCEHIAVRAGLASLANDYGATITLYKQAADLSRAIDPELSLSYEQEADRARNTHAQYFSKHSDPAP